MKRLLTLFLAAGLAFSTATAAQAIDFNIKGQWLMGFSGGDGSLLDKTRTENGKHAVNANDKFSAMQRIRLQLDAVASENLSGTVFFEIGDTTWGNSDSGGALGADAPNIIELKNAYLDWTLPETDLKIRMGLMAFALPNAAGGSAVLDDDVAGITASYKFTDNVGLTAAWLRPYNDNYKHTGERESGNDRDSYLDNMDLFMLSAPLTFDGIQATPWAMFGVVGQNAFRGNGNWHWIYTPSGYNTSRWKVKNDGEFGRSKANSSAFWAGIPVKLSLWDPLNIEFDFNYGVLESMGRGWLTKAPNGPDKRFDTRREGWLAKALVEYKMDWGTPGILGWYSSGDDDNPANGSERMPGVSPCGNFTSFLGDGNWGWSSNGALYDRNMSYSGTWGVGLQIKDMSFIENLKHTVRAVYWGGTNSPSMAKYASSPWSWGTSYEHGDFGDDLELYLTTNDSLVEFNLINAWQVYDNLEINLELGYIINGIDHDTWKKANNRMYGYDKQDAWKAQLIFAYTF